MLSGAVHPAIAHTPTLPLAECPFGVPLVPLPRRRNGPVYSRQVTIQEKCSVGFSRLARLPLQKIAVTHGGPARQCSPPSASRWRPRTSALAPSPNQARPCRSAAMIVVPEPTKGSYTVSANGVGSSTVSSNATGFMVGCSRLGSPPGPRSRPQIAAKPGHRPGGVGRCGAPQGGTDPALVLQGKTGGRQRTGILRKRLNGHLGLVSGQAGGCRKVTR